MSSFNKVILIGHLGKNAELRYTTGGSATTTINLATTESWKDKTGQRVEKTEWHRVILWGKTAEALAPYLLTGKQIAVEGKIQTREWVDKQDVKRYTTEIRADRVVLLGSGPKGSAGVTHVRDEDVGHGEPTNELEDAIPF